MGPSRCQPCTCMTLRMSASGPPCMAISAWRYSHSASKLLSYEAKSSSSPPKLSSSCPHPGSIAASSDRTLGVLPDISLSLILHGQPDTKSSHSVSSAPLESRLCSLPTTVSVHRLSLQPSPRCSQQDFPKTQI